MIAHLEKYVFSIESNSTISSLKFESDNRELNFIVSGQEGTEGYVRATIAKSIISNIDSIEVKLNDKEIEYATTSLDDSWLLYFTYSHSSHIIVIKLGGTSSLFGISIIDLAVIGLVLAIVCGVVVFFIFRRNRVKKS